MCDATTYIGIWDTGQLLAHFCSESHGNIITAAKLHDPRPPKERLWVMLECPLVVAPLSDESAGVLSVTDSLTSSLTRQKRQRLDQWTKTTAEVHTKLLELWQRRRTDLYNAWHKFDELSLSMQVFEKLHPPIVLFENRATLHQCLAWQERQATAQYWLDRANLLEQHGITVVGTHHAHSCSL